MRRYITMLVAAAALVLPQIVQAQDGKATTTEHMLHASPASLQWKPIQPEGFPPGAEIAVLYGDPSVADQPYAFRLRFKDGYRFPAHYHPKDENLTILSGTFLLQMGNKATENLVAYGPGDFIHIPPLQPHYGAIKGETIVQLHGIGPYQVLLAK